MAALPAKLAKNAAKWSLADGWSRVYNDNNTPVYTDGQVHTKQPVFSPVDFAQYYAKAGTAKKKKRARTEESTTVPKRDKAVVISAFLELTSEEKREAFEQMKSILQDAPAEEEPDGGEEPDVSGGDE